MSLSEKECILFSDEGIYKANILDEVIEKTLGRGDYIIAGFVFNKQRGFSDVEAFKYACCSGIATTFAIDIKMRREIDEVYDRFTVEKIG